MDPGNGRQYAAPGQVRVCVSAPCGAPRGVLRRKYCRKTAVTSAFFRRLSCQRKSFEPGTWARADSPAFPPNYCHLARNYGDMKWVIRLKATLQAAQGTGTEPVQCHDPPGSRALRKPLPPDPLFSSPNCSQSQPNLKSTPGLQQFSHSD